MYLYGPMLCLGNGSFPGEARGFPGLSEGVVLIPAVLFLCLFFIRPWWGIAFFVFARTCADAAGHYTVGISGFSLNAAGTLGLAVYATGGYSFVLLVKRKSVPWRGLIPFAFLTAASALALAAGWRNFGSGSLFRALPELIRMGTFPLFFLSVRMATDVGDRKRLVQLFVAAIMLAGIWGAVQFASGRGNLEQTSGVLRATGPFAYPNTLGYFLLLGINLACSHLLFTDSAASSRRTRRWLYVLIGGLVCFLALTASFTIFGLLVVSVVLFGLLKRKPALFALLVIAFLAASPLFFNRIRMVLRSDVAADISEGVPRNTLTARFVIWNGLFSVFREKPLAGWGLETVQRINPVRRPAGMGCAPHNDALLFMTEGGIAGLLLFSAFHASVLLYLAHRAKENKMPGAGWSIHALWITWICCMAGSLANNFLSFTAFVLLFWGLAALCAEQTAES